MSDHSTPVSSRSSSLSSSPPRTPPNLHQNSIDPAAKWLVQKFGGTSVGKFAVKIAEDIVSFVLLLCKDMVSMSNTPLTTQFRNYIDQSKVAIVCSARSGSTKDLGTTSLLLRAASEALHRRGKTTSTPGTTTPVSKGSFPYSQSPPTDPPSRSGSNSPPPTDKTFIDFNGTVDLIRQDHFNAAKASVRDPDILKELESEIDKDCDWLRGFLFAARVSFLSSLIFTLL